MRKTNAPPFGPGFFQIMVAATKEAMAQSAQRKQFSTRTEHSESAEHKAVSRLARAVAAAPKNMCTPEQTWKTTIQGLINGGARRAGSILECLMVARLTSSVDGPST